MNDPDTVMKVARQFAEHIADATSPDDVDEIDARNLFEGCKDVCHSHDFCDANVYMQLAIMDVTGVDAASQLPEMSEPTSKLWDEAWKAAKTIGFRRLSMVRGRPDIPAEEIQLLRSTAKNMKVLLPGLSPVEEHPLEVCLDYWGRNPHLQVLCYNHDDEEGAPKVCVRYSREGKVVEVIVGNVTLVKDADGEFQARPYANTSDTPWEIERDATPACVAGDRLQMPSGQVATVMHLRDRYDNDIEQFRAYNETYGILECLDGYPASSPRHQVYTSVEQAWEANPLTAGTTDPGDFSFVPNQKFQ